METGISIEQDYELWILLTQTDVAISRSRQNDLRQFGISRMQLAALVILKASKVPPTPAEISRWIFREPHTVSGLLKRMEKNGLIKREHDSERKHIIRVVMTDKGEQVYHEAMQAKGIPKIMSCLSSKEKKNLKVYLMALRDKALEELVERPQLPFP